MQSGAGNSDLLRGQRAAEERAFQVKSDHPIVGDAILAAAPSTKLSRKHIKRAEEARIVGAALTVLSERGIRVLHDRSVPGTDGVIEHVVVGNNGVTVVRSIPMKGRVRVAKSSVHIGGSNVSLVEHGLMSRVITVRHLLGGEAEVMGALCLVRQKAAGVKFFGRTAIGSTASIVAHLGEIHAEASGQIDIDRVADELDGIFLPAALLS